MLQRPSCPKVIILSYQTQHDRSLILNATMLSMGPTDNPVFLHPSFRIPIGCFSGRKSHYLLGKFLIEQALGLLVSPPEHSFQNVKLDHSKTAHNNNNNNPCVNHKMSLNLKRLHYSKFSLPSHLVLRPLHGKHFVAVFVNRFDFSQGGSYMSIVSVQLSSFLLSRSLSIPL